MVKSVVPQQGKLDVSPLSSTTGPVNISTNTSGAFAQPPNFQVPSPALSNLRGGGQAGAGSVVTDRQRTEAYRNIEGEMDRGTQALMAYRQNHNPASLIEARTHLEAAQNAYQAAFPSSEGVIMIRDGSNVISSYDVGGLNTRLNAALLSLRRAEQLERASH